MFIRPYIPREKMVQNEESLMTITESGKNGVTGADASRKGRSSRIGIPLRVL